MKDIVCPNCGTTFQVDESVYAAIVQQIRTHEFNDELEQRTAQINEQFKNREDAIRKVVEQEMEISLHSKDLAISQLKNEVIRLQGLVTAGDMSKQSALNELSAIKAKELFDAIAKKDSHIADLNNKLATSKQVHEVEMLKERNSMMAQIQNLERQIMQLQSNLEAGKLAATFRENQLREHHQLQLQDKQAEIERLRDFKLKLSTKMVGETLEQHCTVLFEQARSMGLYPNASFEKDNSPIEHSKGDFIFRDFINGHEYVSIMFEMKNEMDDTVAKHRNDDFLDKLDKDRRLKRCEYAVLVSMLEQDNELYNTGIVDKGHRYPKMLVIRPQFFIPVLRLICEGARTGFDERVRLTQELETARSQSADFAKFEDKINRFKTNFSHNVMTAHKKFTAATEGIDKTIEVLEKQIKALRDIKANFEASEQRLLKANELAEEDLTIKKLTHGNPVVRKMIEDAK